MSTQLILYPQYNAGYDFNVSTYNQFIVNGSLFTNLNATNLHSTTFSTPYQDVVFSAPATVVNTWYRFRTIAGGATWGEVSPPQSASNSLVLSYNGTTVGRTGVYQQMTGLVVGADYDIIINIGTAAVGTLDIRLFNGSGGTQVNSYSHSSNVSTITQTFTCTNTNQTIMLDYTSTAGQLVISSLKCLEAGQSPTQIFSDLQDGQVICDLYEEEDIPLTLSVDDFTNVAEKVQSYSKDFNLPATKRNNQIFDNVFDITRTATGINFNPYVKTQCILKQDGYVLFQGYLRLISINNKKGELSYNVNLYSEVIALADFLKDKKFKDIDFEELEHAYNKTNIKRSWNSPGGTGITYLKSNTSGYRDDNTTVKYPFVDWQGQILISDGTNGTTDYPELPHLSSAFRPFINIKYLINRIFQDSSFTWESAFFDGTDFGNLYMDFNWGADNTPALSVESGPTTYYGVYCPDPFVNHYAGNTLTNLKLCSGAPLIAGTSPANYNETTNVLTATTLNEFYEMDYAYQAENLSGSTVTVEFQWTHTTAAGVVEPAINYQSFSVPAGATVNWTGVTSVTLQTGDTLEAQFKSSTGGTDVRQYPGGASQFYGCYVGWGIGTGNIVGGTLMNNLRGDLGQWDFLKGIMTMFNLVSMSDPDNPNHIIIEPYGDIFISNTAGTNLASRSIQHDWTDKIDDSDMQLNPLTNLNQHVIFQYEEDEDDTAFSVYKKSTNGFLYGSKEISAETMYNGLQTILQGTKENKATPFAATVVKPVFNQFSDFITPSIFSRSDGTPEGFDNSPRILFNNGKRTLNAAVTYYIPAENGLSSEEQSEFLQFSHLSEIPVLSTTRDINFGLHQLFSPLQTTVNNLYQTYWSPYINELYNADTRTMKLKVNLSPADINTFQFSDKVMIKNRVFRVNKIEYKPNDLAKVEFILIP